MSPMSHAPNLMTPFTFPELEVANRVVLAPMTRARAGESRVPNDLMATYYRQRSNAGLLISEATTISERANGWVHSPGVYTQEMVDGWRKVTDAVHDAGSRIFLQLWHCGRASHSDFHGGEPPLAASAVKIDGDEIHTPEGKKPYETPRAMTAEEIAATIADYRIAAENARVAGFDGVEVHAANGYLIDTFLQSKTNHREDAYGGSVENRTRFLTDVVQAVMTVWPSNRVGVRLSPNGSFNDMGSPDYREQFTRAAKALDPLGLAYLHLLDGLAFGFHELGEPMTLKDFRGVFGGPLIANCGYDKEQGETAVESGDADLVAYGRPYISNPDLAVRFDQGHPLAADAPQDVWYSPTGAKGYTDYPPFAEAA